MCPPLNAQDLAFLEELERQLGQEALDQRQYERAPLRLALSMTPADTSRAGEPANLGTTPKPCLRPLGLVSGDLHHSYGRS